MPDLPKPEIPWFEDLVSEDLDEIVHDAASALASNANNEGVKGQFNFLMTVCGWTEKEIKQAVQQTHPTTCSHPGCSNDSVCQDVRGSWCEEHRPA